MRYIFVIITLTGLLLQTFSKGLVWMEFMVNRSYIAKELCVNRAKPQMNCNGQCYLMQQMEQEKQQDQQGNALKDKYEIIIAVMDVPFSLQPDITVTTLYTGYEQGHSQRTPTGVFRPPQAVIA